MIKIYVCEDDKKYRDIITDTIEKYILIEDLDITLALSTPDPEDILRQIKNNDVNGLYFLDIELNGAYDGLALAQQIRHYDPRGYIVFITAYAKYLTLTFNYQIEALDYINKTENDIGNRIIKCIKNACQKYNARSYSGRYIFKSRSGHMVSCEHKDILFFQTYPETAHMIIVHTKKRQYIFYGTLDSVMDELLTYKFVRCHKSCIVNLDNLSQKCKEDLRQGKNKITMSNGADCYVSTRKRKKLLNMINLK